LDSYKIKILRTLAPKEKEKTKSSAKMEEIPKMTGPKVEEAK